MNYFSVAAIFKREEPYIGDWVKYHLGIGAEHIWLYDNDSGDRSAEIAKDIGRDRVTIHPCPGHPVQHVAYARCLHDHRQESRWISFLDVDEYLVCYPPLMEVLKSYEKHPAICPHWRLFGSNGRLKYSPEPVPERFTRSQQDVNQHVKSIVNPMRTNNWVTAHRFTHDVPPVDENHKEIGMTDSIPPNGTADIIYVAHYFTKSKEEFVERRSRPRPDTGEYRYNVEESFAAHDRNEVENLDVLNTWKKL